MEELVSKKQNLQEKLELVREKKLFFDDYENNVPDLIDLLRKYGKIAAPDAEKISADEFSVTDISNFKKYGIGFSTKQVEKKVDGEKKTVTITYLDIKLFEKIKSMFVTIIKPKMNELQQNEIYNHYGVADKNIRIINWLIDDFIPEFLIKGETKDDEKEDITSVTHAKELNLSLERSLAARLGQLNKKIERLRSLSVLHELNNGLFVSIHQELDNGQLLVKDNNSGKYFVVNKTDFKVHQKQPEPEPEVEEEEELIIPTRKKKFELVIPEEENNLKIKIADYDTDQELEILITDLTKDYLFFKPGHEYLLKEKFSKLLYLDPNQIISKSDIVNNSFNPVVLLTLDEFILNGEELDINHETRVSPNPNETIISFDKIGNTDYAVTFVIINSHELVGIFVYHQVPLLPPPKEKEEEEEEQILTEEEEEEKPKEKEKDLLEILSNSIKMVNRLVAKNENIKWKDIKTKTTTKKLLEKFLQHLKTGNPISEVSSKIIILKDKELNAKIWEDFLSKISLEELMPKQFSFEMERGEQGKMIEVESEEPESIFREKEEDLTGIRIRLGPIGSPEIHAIISSKFNVNHGIIFVHKDIPMFKDLVANHLKINENIGYFMIQKTEILSPNFHQGISRDLEYVKAKKKKKKGEQEEVNLIVFQEDEYGASEEQKSISRNKNVKQAIRDYKVLSKKREWIRSTSWIYRDGSLLLPAITQITVGDQGLYPLIMTGERILITKFEEEEEEQGKRTRKKLPTILYELTADTQKPNILVSFIMQEKGNRDDLIAIYVYHRNMINEEKDYLYEPEMATSGEEKKEEKEEEGLNFIRIEIEGRSIDTGKKQTIAMWNRIQDDQTCLFYKPGFEDIFKSQGVKKTKSFGYFNLKQSSLKSFQFNNEENELGKTKYKLEKFGSDGNTRTYTFKGYTIILFSTNVDGLIGVKFIPRREEKEKKLEKQKRERWEEEEEIEEIDHIFLKIIFADNSTYTYDPQISGPTFILRGEGTNYLKTQVPRRLGISDNYYPEIIYGDISGVDKYLNRVKLAPLEIDLINESKIRREVILKSVLVNLEDLRMTIYGDRFITSSKEHPYNYYKTVYQSSSGVYVTFVVRTNQRDQNPEVVGIYIYSEKFLSEKRLRSCISCGLLAVGQCTHCHLGFFCGQECFENHSCFN